MSITQYPNGISSFGMPLIGKTTGNVFFVHNSGSNGNSGTDSENPFADIDHAINQCTANKGDVIVAMPGHTEAITAADAIAFDTAGVSLIGMGTGQDQPQIDFTHADGGVVVSAPSVTFDNINFHSNITDVLIGVEIEATGDYCTVRNCKFDVETTGTDEFLYSIYVTAAANYCTFEDNYIDMGIGGATAGIGLIGASTGHTIRRNYIIGDYSVGCIEGKTAASLELDIGYNVMFNGGGADIGTQPCIDLTGNATGIIYHNYCGCNLATMAASIVAAKCMTFDNYYNEDVAGTSTCGLIGTAYAD